MRLSFMTWNLIYHDRSELVLSTVNVNFLDLGDDEMWKCVDKMNQKREAMWCNLTNWMEI
ncbi:CLUMA_CG010279, isoform A [Clunio marinus]|uniref:CLUMA_CG010279, isoform A n=1 Tax=Clunio marinus TaxID=568069 RepID=A0A1J1IBX6_9DIPT|nr:CLUMA_CG010279, isoform A [Clunio marinus]